MLQFWEDQILCKRYRGVADSFLPNTTAAALLTLLFCSLQQSKDLSTKQDILVLAN